ncbi:Protein translocase subunit SecA, partial [human gut metagenome]
EVVGIVGESRFYLSMEDDLMRMFASGLAQRIMASDAYPDDVPLESKMVSKAIASAQRQVESRNYEIRKNVLKYDDVMTEQREKGYSELSLGGRREARRRSGRGDRNAFS